MNAPKHLSGLTLNGESPGSTLQCVEKEAEWIQTVLLITTFE
jgi:hypothetical protein